MIFSVVGSVFKYTIYIVFIVVVSFLFDVYLNPVTTGKFPDELTGLEIDDLVRKSGYPFEKHEVITKDGYILEMHRVSHGKNQKNPNSRPIILMHGLLSGSFHYLLTGDTNSLGLYLAENGFDVWMPNARGNYYSRKHLTLNADKEPSKFFDYSWNEIGIYDLPACIDHVLMATGKSKLHYGGHSQGSTSFFVMLSERPEYNDKVINMAGLSPVVYARGIKGPSFTLPALFQNTCEGLAELIGWHELLPRSHLMQQLGSKLCKENSLGRNICASIVMLAQGFDFQNFNQTLFPRVFWYNPAGASIKQMMHYTQILNSDIFQKYDHGKEKNLIKYGTESPPLYKFENMKVKIALFSSTADWLTTEENIDKLQKKLPNVYKRHLIADDTFAHPDFPCCNKLAEDLLYKHVLDALNVM